MEYDQTRMQLHIYNAIYKETDAVYSGFAKRSGLSDCAFWLCFIRSGIRRIPAGKRTCAANGP